MGKIRLRALGGGRSSRVLPHAAAIEPHRAGRFGAVLAGRDDDRVSFGRALVIAALGDIARARGMMQLARDTGLTREGLYKALSPDGNPSFATVMKVCKALGLKLRTEAVEA